MVVSIAVLTAVKNDEHSFNSLLVVGLSVAVPRWTSVDPKMLAASSADLLSKELPHDDEALKATVA